MSYKSFKVIIEKGMVNKEFVDVVKMEVDNMSQNEVAQICLQIAQQIKSKKIIDVNVIKRMD